MKPYDDMHDFPTTYGDLLAMHPPRAIHDQVELGNATEIIDALAGFDLSPDQEDYFDTLSTLVEKYENEHHPIKRHRGVQLLKALLKEHGMNAADLAELLGVHRSLGYKILSGARSLTVNHIRILSKRFKVGAEVFV